MPQNWKSSSRELFGNVAFLLFASTQILDGVLTYLGVSLFGVRIEGNPLLARLMMSLGIAPALAAAKGVATGFGAVLHLGRVHVVVAALALAYLVLAIVPWTTILFLR